MQKTKYRKKPFIVEAYQAADVKVVNGTQVAPGDYVITDGAGNTSVVTSEVMERDFEHVGDFLTFSQALDALKEGKRVARRKWIDKGMWLVLINSKSYSISNPKVYDSEGHQENYLPFIAIRTQNNKIVAWVASHMDMLSKDWAIV